MCVYNFPLLVRAPTVIDSSVGAFSISISWTSSGPVVERYEVEWQRDTSGECPDEHTDSATVSGGSERSYDITDLFGDSSYSIRVSAMNAAGSAISDPLVISTAEAGIPMLNYVCNVLQHAILSSPSSHSSTC